MTQATINGHTYSDDGSSARDMLHGGHRTWFLPMVGDVATVAEVVAGQAAQTAIDAASAADMAGSTRATSTTNLTVSAGTKNLVIQAGKQFGGGDYVTISRTSAPTIKMNGSVAGYSGTALAVEVASSTGSGAYSDWTIAMSGPPGATGPTGDGSIAYLPKNGAYTITADDKAKLIDCTGGTYTLSFQPAGVLGSTWTTWVKNSGPGVITLDPYMGETISGESSYDVNPRRCVMVQSNGASLTVAFDSVTQRRRPIFSTISATKTPVSSSDDMSLPSYATGLSASYGIGNIHYANSLFLAQGLGPQGNIATSADGKTWVLRAMPSAETWFLVSNGTDMFVAVASGKTATAKSVNGTVWVSGAVLPESFGTKPWLLALMGGRCLVIKSSTSVYYSDDNAATWSAAQTLPFTPDILTHVGGSFFAADTLYTSGYTSPTGETGSWTARPLPVASSTSVLVWKDTDGSLLCMSGGVVDNKIFRTVDGVNWEDTGVTAPVAYNHRPITVGGVKAYFSTIYPYSTTHHNGVWVTRVASNDGSMGQYLTGASPSGIMCIPCGSGGVIARYDPSLPGPTAIFEE